MKTCMYMYVVSAISFFGCGGGGGGGGWAEKKPTIYHIQSNYRTYPYKRTVKQFRTLWITASVLFGCFFIKAYAVGTHLNCIDLSMHFK